MKNPIKDPEAMIIITLSLIVLIAMFLVAYQAVEDRYQREAAITWQAGTDFTRAPQIDHSFCIMQPLRYGQFSHEMPCNPTDSGKMYAGGIMIIDNYPPCVNGKKVLLSWDMWDSEFTRSRSSDAFKAMAKKYCGKLK